MSAVTVVTRDMNAWLEAVEKEAVCRGQVQQESWASGGPASREALQHWWRSIEEVFACYSALNDSVPPPLPLPLVRALGGFAGHLGVGHLPGPIKDAVAEGRTSPVPGEREDINWAVTYHHAAAKGFKYMGTLLKISDPHPTKTVSSAFGVLPGTVRKWNRTRPAVVQAADELSVEDIERRMVTAGERYRARGRSAAAISARARASRN